MRLLKIVCGILECKMASMVRKMRLITELKKDPAFFLENKRAF